MASQLTLSRFENAVTGRELNRLWRDTVEAQARAEGVDLDEHRHRPRDIRPFLEPSTGSAAI